MVEQTTTSAVEQTHRTNSILVGRTNYVFPYEQRQNQKPRPLLLFFACFVNTEGTAIAKMQMAENMHSILFSPSAACYEYFQKLNIFGIDN